MSIAESTEQSVRLYNTLTRCKEFFTPLDSQKVRVYSCGPTVYDDAHIGNARSMIVFDILFRLLRLKYGSDRVVFVRNITDVDDKINARAQEERVPISTITERTIKQFRKDMASLGILPPTVEPLATEHIDSMIEIIEHLISKNFAYVACDHVFFSPKQMNRSGEGILPRYGVLSNCSQEEMYAGARIEVLPYKRDPMDFVLWKPSDSHLPGWESPWGRGRPGWHIECSAMSWKYLGETFDIHCGGIDLLFPHHENEIAQSCCAFSVPRMAQLWMHNGLLRLEGKKMSKSQGNFLTIKELLREWPPQVLRFQMLMTHYRQPLDWTRERCVQVLKILDRWHEITAEISYEETSSSKVPHSVLAHLYDDLNTPAVIAELHKFASQDSCVQARRDLAVSGRFLGFLTDKKTWYSQRFGQEPDQTFLQMLTEKVVKRSLARKDRDWILADEIRSDLLQKGIVLEDVCHQDSNKMVTRFEISGSRSGIIIFDCVLNAVDLQWEG